LGSGCEQAPQVEVARVHRELAVGRARPLFLRPVPVKLDAVLVGIAQVERLADAVIGSAVERNLRLDQTAQRIAQRRAGRIEDREMVQAGRALGRRRAAAALPGVEPDVMMITAGRNERRLQAKPLRQLKAEYAAIKGQRPVDIGDLQMHVADADACVDRGGDHPVPRAIFV